jgi:hypothetical protein
MFEDVKVEDGRDGEVAVPTVTAYFSFYPGLVPLPRFTSLLFLLLLLHLLCSPFFELASFWILIEYFFSGHCIE